MGQTNQMEEARFFQPSLVASRLPLAGGRFPFCREIQLHGVILVCAAKGVATEIVRQPFFMRLTVLSAMFLVSWMADAACAQDPDPLKWHMDKSLFPRSYGLLANEYLLYPIDQRDWPVKIDRTRQLFVDDYLIASLENVQRKVNPARKHPADRPGLAMGRPWSGVSQCNA